MKRQLVNNCVDIHFSLIHTCAELFFSFQFIVQPRKQYCETTFVSRLLIVIYKWNLKTLCLELVKHNWLHEHVSLYDYEYRYAIMYCDYCDTCLQVWDMRYEKAVMEVKENEEFISDMIIDDKHRYLLATRFAFWNKVVQ